MELRFHRRGSQLKSNVRQNFRPTTTYHKYDGITIASVHADGVRQLLVYCRGKRKGDWPCHHEATLPVDRFADDEALADIERRCGTHQFVFRSVWAPSFWKTT